VTLISARLLVVEICFATGDESSMMDVSGFLYPFPAVLGGILVLSIMLGTKVEYPRLELLGLLLMSDVPPFCRH